MTLSPDLKKFLDTKKKDFRLLGDVERHLLRMPDSDRRTDVLHPSEIIKADWCHKYAYHLLNGGKAKKDKPSLRLQNIFDEGHAIHDKWQSRFHDMGVLYGKFGCLSCNKVTEGVSPTHCPECNGAMKYKEVSLVDPDLRIAGHTDGWIKGIGQDCLIEIKSVGAGTLRFEAPELLFDADGDVSRAWKRVNRPFRSHLLQGQMYLELAKRMHGDEAPKEIVFIYELKADQDYKEFTVKADYEFVAHVFKAAQKVVDAVNEGKMPKCNIDRYDGCKYCNSIGE
jgi:CRISPR/Cas system-associated exonuclease Cas4 (RecB family)